MKVTCQDQDLIFNITAPLTVCPFPKNHHSGTNYRLIEFVTVSSISTISQSCSHDQRAYDSLWNSSQRISLTVGFEEILHRWRLRIFFKHLIHTRLNSFNLFSCAPCPILLILAESVKTSLGGFQSKPLNICSDLSTLM